MSSEGKWKKVSGKEVIWGVRREVDENGRK